MSYLIFVFIYLSPAPIKATLNLSMHVVFLKVYFTHFIPKTPQVSIQYDAGTQMLWLHRSSDAALDGCSVVQTNDGTANITYACKLQVLGLLGFSWDQCSICPHANTLALTCVRGLVPWRFVGWSQ